MSDVNRNKLRALATGCRDEVIRSHGWEGTIEEAELIARDQRLLMELSPEVVIQLLDDYDDLLAELQHRDKLLEETRQAWDTALKGGEIMRAERDQLRAEVERLTKLAEAISADCNTVACERNDLRTTLKVVREQQAVLYVSAYDLSDDKLIVVHTTRTPNAVQTLRLYALPPQQPDAVSVPREQSDVPLYAAINRACGELPEGWYIELNAERDGAWVALLNAELEVVDFPTNNERLDYTVNDAVEFALLSTRQAEEGE